MPTSTSAPPLNSHGLPQSVKSSVQCPRACRVRRGPDGRRQLASSWQPKPGLDCITITGGGNDMAMRLSSHPGMILQSNTEYGRIYQRSLSPRLELGFEAEFLAVVRFCRLIYPGGGLWSFRWVVVARYTRSDVEGKEPRNRITKSKYTELKSWHLWTWLADKRPSDISNPSRHSPRRSLLCIKIFRMFLAIYLNSPQSYLFPPPPGRPRVRQSRAHARQARRH
jgi:hypothetical protein